MEEQELKAGLEKIVEGSEYKRIVIGGFGRIPFIEESCSERFKPANEFTMKRFIEPRLELMNEWLAEEYGRLRDLRLFSRCNIIRMENFLNLPKISMDKKRLGGSWSIDPRGAILSPFLGKEHWDDKVAREIVRAAARACVHTIHTFVQGLLDETPNYVGPEKIIDLGFLGGLENPEILLQTAHEDGYFDVKIRHCYGGYNKLALEENVTWITLR